MSKLILCLAIVATAACSGEIDNTQNTGADASVNGGADARNNPGGPDARQNFGEPAALMGITAAHNQVRAGVGVGPMTWNDNLAATAQAWANTCTDNDPPAGLIDHNDGRSDGHPYYVGENVYGSSGASNPLGAVSSWASEVSDYTYATNTCAPGAVCGHYTQIVWATSVELGCAVSNCPGLTYSNSVVCNYGPGGNSGGSPY